MLDWDDRGLNVKFNTMGKYFLSPPPAGVWSVPIMQFESQTFFSSTSKEHVEIKYLVRRDLRKGFPTFPLS